MSRFAHGRALAYAAAGLGIQAAWGMLLAFLPATLEHLGAPPFVIGSVMALDPVTALVALPLVGAWSDRLKSPWGRRLPFLAGGALMAALGLAGLATTHDVPTAAAMAALVCLGLNGALGPYKAILADEFPPEAHALTSGLMSLLREAGTLIAFAAGAWSHTHGAGLPFLIGAGLLALSAAWTVGAEARQPRRATAAHVRTSLAETLRSAEGLPLLAAAQAAWWFAIQAVKTFVVLFLVHEVAHVADVASPAGQAAMQQAVGILALTGVAGIAASFPAGMAASRFGQGRVAIAGLGMLLAAYALAGVADNFGAAIGLALLYGAGFATIQVLAYPLLLAAWPRERHGAVAAIGNMLLAGPQLLALLVMGAVVQATGSYRAPFWVGAIAVSVSLGFFIAYQRRKRPPVAVLSEAA